MQSCKQILLSKVKSLGTNVSGVLFFCKIEGNLSISWNIIIIKSEI